MSILIKGISMPSKKNGAVLIIYPDGKCAVEDGAILQAVELPPHGRLIDADALSDDLITMTVHIEAAGSLLRMVRAAPTIIEAEGEE